MARCPTLLVSVVGSRAGKAGILLRNDAGTFREYQMNGVAVSNAAWIGSPGAGWAAATSSSAFK